MSHLSCHTFLPAPGQQQGGPGSEWVLVPGEGGELLPQSLEAGPLLRLPVPARQHELVCSGRALRRAGHAVARVHPQEGLVVGHACRGQDKGVGAGRSLPTCLPPPPGSHLPLPAASQEALGRALPICIPHTLRMGSSTCIGRLTPAENLVEENPKGPDIGFDRIVPSGQCLWSRPLVRDVAVVGKVDVLLQSDTGG